MSKARKVSKECSTQSSTLEGGGLVGSGLVASGPVLRETAGAVRGSARPCRLPVAGAAFVLRAQRSRYRPAAP